MVDNRQNLERCFALCHQRAWRLAVSLLHDSHEAFDAVQQAFLVAAAKPDKVPRDDPWPWFATVVVHEARNRRRKKRPQPGLPVEVEMPQDNDPARHAQDSESRAALRSAVEDLPEHEREAVTLTQLSGLTHAQAAVALGLPVKTLSTHVTRGLQRLRTRLGNQSEELLAGMAAAPLAAPPGGWEAALASWKAAAFSGTAPGAAAAATGGIILAKNTLIAATLALVIGLAGGAILHTVLGTQEAAPPAQGHNQPLAQSESTAGKSTNSPGAGNRTSTASEGNSEGSADLRRELDDALAREATLKLERDKLRTQASSAEASRDELRRDIEKLTAELEPYRAEAAEKGPTFTFGKFGGIEGVKRSDWKELSHASRVVSDTIRDIRKYQLKGEQPPRELYVTLQQHTEMVRKYEYLTLDKLPTWARHNGELTHPISHANLIAGELKSAGLPLSEDQVKAIEALGLKYESDFENASRKYGENTPRCEKLQDEFLLKGVFVDAVWDVLRPEQRALFVTPETLHIAGTDLYCPTLMLIHTSPVIAGADAAEIRGKLRALLVQTFKVTTENQPALDLLLDNWLGDVSQILTPVRAADLRSYTFDQAAVALRAHCKLVRGMRDTCGLETERLAALLDDYSVYIPRVQAP